MFPQRISAPIRICGQDTVLPLVPTTRRSVAIFCWLFTEYNNKPYFRKDSGSRTAVLAKPSFAYAASQPSSFRRQLRDFPTRPNNLEHQVAGKQPVLEGGHMAHFGQPRDLAGRNRRCARTRRRLGVRRFCFHEYAKVCRACTKPHNPCGTTPFGVGLDMVGPVTF